jgi:hypothetical protein
LYTVPDGSNALCSILPALRFAPEQRFSAKFSGQYAGHQSATGAGQASC